MKRGGPLKRRTALKAKTPLKCQRWFRDMAAVKGGKGNKTARKPLKKVSRSRRRELVEYFRGHKDFLARFPVCGICLARGITPPRRSTEIHHARGRIKKLLNDRRFFVPSCRECREWPHEHRAEAEALGVIASAAEWNTLPAD